MKPNVLESVPSVVSVNLAKRRGWIMFFIFLSTIICYTDRSNISVVSTTMMKHFGWSNAEFGMLSSAFFVGYLVLGIPGGWLSDKFGGVKFLALGVFIWSLFTGITPLAWGLGSMIVIRLLLGVGEGVNFPSHTAVVSNWSPVKSRGRWQGLNMSGMAIGVSLATPITAWLTSSYSWKSSFYFFGAIGIIWAVIWMMFAKDHPRKVRGVTSAQLAELNQSHIGEETKISWARMFSNKEVWGVTITYFFQNYNWYLYLTWLPAYFVKARHFTMMKVGIYGVLPWIAAFIAMNLAGYWSDHLSKTRNLTSARRIPVITSFVGTAVFMALAAFTPNQWIALLYVTLSVGFLGLNFSMYWTLPIDIGPKSAGTISGVMNTSGTVAGIFAPTITGVLLDTVGSWQAVLFVGAALAIIGAVLTRFMISAKQVLD